VVSEIKTMWAVRRSAKLKAVLVLSHSILESPMICYRLIAYLSCLDCSHPPSALSWTLLLFSRLQQQQKSKS